MDKPPSLVHEYSFLLFFLAEYFSYGWMKGHNVCFFMFPVSFNDRKKVAYSSRCGINPKMVCLSYRVTNLRWTLLFLQVMGRFKTHRFIALFLGCQVSNKSGHHFIFAISKPFLFRAFFFCTPQKPQQVREYLHNLSGNFIYFGIGTFASDHAC